MKNSLYILIIVAFFSACKYEDGPKFSLRSKAHRAINTWYLDQAFEEGANKTDDYKNGYYNYQIAIKKDKTYEIKYRPFNTFDYKETGTWDFNGDKSNLNFTPTSGSNNTSSWKILRLKETEIWVVQKINGKDVELHMKD